MRRENPETFELVLARARENCHTRPGDQHTYIDCPICPEHPIMRIDNFHRHWARKHDPRRHIRREEAADPVLHICEDCDYKTTKTSSFNKHMRNGCPRKKREQKAEEKKEKRQEAERKRS